MDKSNALVKEADLPDEIRDTVNDATARIVNQAIERRVSRVVSADTKTREIGERFWKPSMITLVTVLVVALGWLLVGALR
jgi:hypothetical protein